MMRILCRPCRGLILRFAFPRLTPWANVYRTSGAETGKAIIKTRPRIPLRAKAGQSLGPEYSRNYEPRWAEGLKVSVDF